MTKITDIPAIRFKGFSDTWEQRKLGELCNITTGKLDANAMVSDGQYDFYTSGIDVFKIDVAAFEGPAITIAGNGASVGYMHLADGKFNAYQRTYVLTDFLADRQFLNVAIGNELPNKIQEEVRGSGIPYIVLNMLTDLAIPFPSHEEQYAIGVYFQQLDHLITLHQRKYDKLTNVKKSMLGKMFPQNGSNVPEIRFKGFTEAWEQRKLGEIGSVSMCRRIFKEQTSENGEIPFYKIGTFGGEADAFISRELFEEYKAKYQYPKKGDILISASGSIGRTVVFTGKNEYFQDSNIVWLNHDKHLDNSFLKCFYSIVKWAGIEGSTIKRLYNDNILNTAITLPSVEEQQKIGAYFENLDNLITLHQRKPIVVNSSSTMNALPNQHLYFQVLE